jgi:hypothetical protein
MIRSEIKVNFRYITQIGKVLPSVLLKGSNAELKCRGYYIMWLLHSHSAFQYYRGVHFIVMSQD